MKTYIVPHETVSEVYATEAVHAVKPIKLCLMDEQDVIEGLKHQNNRLTQACQEQVKQINGMMADCEALNDEIDRLKEVARRAQQREVEAVKRYEGLAWVMAWRNSF